jgi:hypothetical protein
VKLILACDSDGKRQWELRGEGGTVARVSHANALALWVMCGINDHTPTEPDIFVRRQIEELKLSKKALAMLGLS